MSFSLFQLTYERPLLCSPSNVNHPYDRKRVIRVAQEICHFYQAAVRCVFSAIHIFDQYLRKSTHKHKPPFYDWIMVVAVRLAIRYSNDQTLLTESQFA